MIDINKILKFLSKNGITILLAVVIIVILRVNGTDRKEYKAELRAKSDSITRLDKQFIWMQDQANSSMEISREALNTANLYRDSLNRANNKIRTNNIRHEREVANLTRIPTDSLYRDVTTWLDTLSF